jgi:hypothetical protein
MGLHTCRHGDPEDQRHVLSRSNDFKHPVDHRSAVNLAADVSKMAPANPTVNTKNEISLYFSTTYIGRSSRHSRLARSFDRVM